MVLGWHVAFAGSITLASLVATDFLVIREGEPDVATGDHLHMETTQLPLDGAVLDAVHRFPPNFVILHALALADEHLAPVVRQRVAAPLAAVISGGHHLCRQNSDAATVYGTSAKTILAVRAAVDTQNAWVQNV